MEQQPPQQVNFQEHIWFLLQKALESYRIHEQQQQQQQQQREDSVDGCFHSFVDHTGAVSYYRQPHPRPQQQQHRHHSRHHPHCDRSMSTYPCQQQQRAVMAPARETTATTPPVVLGVDDELKDLLRHLQYFHIHDPHPQIVQFFDRRRLVITYLNGIASHWIGQEAAKRSIAAGPLDRMGFIRAFGSYGLGVCGPDSDLDVVLVAPCYVRREDFFSTFVLHLRSHFEMITNVEPVEGAFVPVVKLTCDGVDVDLTFARLDKQLYVPSEEDGEDSLLVDDALLGMDDKSTRSLNGWRVCRFIVKYVPNVQIFRLTLMVVKEWAKARLIYSNSYCYLGGVSWAILVAHACHNRPSKTVFGQVHNFFTAFAAWDWKEPVCIAPLQLPSCQCFPSAPKFDPVALYEHHLMPIMTPCYPYQNSSFNITRTTFNCVVTAFREGAALFRQVAERKATFEQFFARADAVKTDYGFFLVLLVEARDETALKRWKGCVESKLRQLMQNFEHVRDLDRAQIFPNSYKVTATPANNTAGVMWLVGLDYKGDPSQSVSIKKTATEWKSGVNLFGLALGQDDPDALYQDPPTILAKCTTFTAASDDGDDDVSFDDASTRNGSSLTPSLLTPASLTFRRLSERTNVLHWPQNPQSLCWCTQCLDRRRKKNVEGVMK
ncbi:Poly(A) polymerase gamma [Hypsibius exemplaris]|uniref:polynucleotide adenylyltransferase n=1 Tax=Hypsibius exemplaris TaxID=2072580 RepID=A0A1W0WT02_HYPEX|nr:Poly(A) polymerase gamma [Hypsibius exemplaris]